MPSLKIYTNAAGDYVTIPRGAVNLDELTDVTLAGLVDNQLLLSASGIFKNQTITTVLSNASTTDLSEGTNLYYTEARVSANTDVAANTAARHDAVTVTDSSEIDFTLTGQDITASLIAGSIDETKLDTSVNASLNLADSAAQSGDNVSIFTNNVGYLTGNETITLSGDVTGSGTTAITTTHANSGVTAGTYGSSTQVAVITVDVKGRVTSASSNPITFPTHPNLSTVLGIGDTTSGENIVISAGDELRIRDAGLTIDSPTDGEMEITADTTLTLTAPTINMADGFEVDLPTAGSRTAAFVVDFTGDPGIYFDRPTATTGAITVRNSTTDYHTFGALNAVAGDAEHTDGTNSMTYDASLNELALSGGLGAIRLPTMTTTQRNALTPTAGDMIYNSTTSKHQGYDGTAWNDFY